MLTVNVYKVNESRDKTITIYFLKKDSLISLK